MIDKYTEYLEKVKEDWNYLEQVPIEYRVGEICLEAVKQDGNAMEYIPEEVINYEMVNIAIETGRSIRYIPEKYLNYNFCERVIKLNPFQIKYIPERLMKT